MKVLLVKPYCLSDHIQPPLGLGYLATAIRTEHEVTILDCLKEHVDLKEFADLVRVGQYDVIGFQCYTIDLPFLKKAIPLVKSIAPHTVIVLGGPHPSSDPVGVMNLFGPQVDYAFRGEAEIGFAQFMRAISAHGSDFESIPGLIWRSNGAVRTNQPLFHEHLDEFGFPAWDLLKPETYPPAQHGAFYARFPIAPVITSRGCPYLCTFCAGRNISGLKHRKRSIDHVISEIRFLLTNHHIREIHIIDDNFSFDREHAKQLLQRIIDERLDITWATPNGVRMETLDEPLLDLMKRSGLYLVSLGIESGSNKVLKRIQKSFDVGDVEEKVRMISAFNMPIAGFFVMGFPGETKDEINQTIRLALRLPLVRANFFTFLPFPGTEAYDSLVRNGELEKIDWDHFYFMNAAYTPPGISRAELKNLQRKAFWRFFLRRRILWYNLSSIRSTRHLYYLIRRFYHWIIMQK